MEKAVRAVDSINENDLLSEAALSAKPLSKPKGAWDGNIFDKASWVETCNSDGRVLYTSTVTQLGGPEGEAQDSAGKATVSSTRVICDHSTAQNPLTCFMHRSSP